MASASQRLALDYRNLQKEEPEGFTATPDEGNILRWTGVIFGPGDTEWENGIFKLELTFPNDYPQNPPKAKFNTEMFHPNIYSDGRVCVNILQGQWTPANDVTSILISLQALLIDPNPDSAANGEAGSLFKNNRAEYIRRVKAVVEKSWDQD
jgi:ubiquitin-conjugating enzyme E2 A